MLNMDIVNKLISYCTPAERDELLMFVTKKINEINNSDNRIDIKKLKPGMLIRNTRINKIHYVIRVYEHFIIVDNDWIQMPIRYEIDNTSDEEIREIYEVEDKIEDSEIDLVKAEYTIKLITKSNLEFYTLLNDIEEAEIKAFIYNLDMYGQVDEFQLLNTKTGRIYDVDTNCEVQLADFKTGEIYEIPFNNLNDYVFYNKLYEEMKLPI